jgi:transposase IS116/IS110/IS902 family protein
MARLCRIAQWGSVGIKEHTIALAVSAHAHGVQLCTRWSDRDGGNGVRHGEELGLVAPPQQRAVPPVVSRNRAEVLLAEIGRDMSRSPSTKHLALWAGICPGHYESAGKRKSGKTRKGSRWLRQLFIEEAHGAAHSKQTYLGALYSRLAARRGEEGTGRGRTHDPGDRLSRPHAQGTL